MTTPEDSWNVKRAAEFLAVKPKTLYRLAAEGTVPSFKVGGLLRFSPKHPAQWRESLMRVRPPSL